MLSGVGLRSKQQPAEGMWIKDQAFGAWPTYASKIWLKTPNSLHRMKRLQSVL
jgi:hypothetical protein